MVAAALAACGTGPAPQSETWIELFNGRDLNGWTPKIVGYPAGEDPFATFRVEDGLLKVRYDGYRNFDDSFGHLFYDEEFSHYMLEVEYRFVGEQVPGGPAWAWRNNGIMYHAQTARAMALHQAFPDSFEFQLLGGDGNAPRPTANLCTPGTRVTLGGSLREEHCLESTSATYTGDQWVRARLLVRGSRLARHWVNGEQVMEYTDLQKEDGTPLGRGAIALQAESHPVDFRAVRLLKLEP